MPNKLTAELLVHARELRMSAEQQAVQKPNLAYENNVLRGLEITKADLEAMLRIDRDFDTTMRYWIDGDNKLWHGPSSPDENLHYSRFEGFMRVAPFGEIWVLQRSSPPDVGPPAIADIKEVTLEQAKDFLRNAWFAQQQVSDLLD